MQLRIARHTERLDEVVRFYRDGLGLPEIGGFRGHAGYDGVFLAVPGTGAHLELTAGGGHGAPAPHPESLLVLYLGDAAAVRSAVARLGAEPVLTANPYWAEHGVAVEDPDGFRVVLVPERWEAGAPDPDVEIGWHAGGRDELRALFALAEDSPQRLEASLEQGRILAATAGGRVVGYLQLTDTATAGEAELKSMAVAGCRQSRGIGRALVERAAAACRAGGRHRLLVATGAADVGNLRFYQRLGFRMLRVEPDAFTPADGYPKGLRVDGIPLRDRVWLVLAL
jgi:ribosomal protein S18 acetylase RimI-like enzyme